MLLNRLFLRQNIVKHHLLNRVYPPQYFAVFYMVFSKKAAFYLENADRNITAEV